MPETAPPTEAAPRTKPLVTGVDFVSLFAQDLDASRHFYGTVLGLPLLTDRAPYNLEFQAGNLTLGILNAAEMGNGMEHSVYHGSIALQVDDVPAVRAQLEAAGVTFSRDTIDTGVCHMGLFNDPDGNGLMLHHRYVPRGD